MMGAQHLHQCSQTRHHPVVVGLQRDDWGLETPHLGSRGCAPQTPAQRRGRVGRQQLSTTQCQLGLFYCWSLNPTNVCGRDPNYESLLRHCWHWRGTTGTARTGQTGKRRCDAAKAWRLSRFASRSSRLTQCSRCGTGREDTRVLMRKGHFLLYTFPRCDICEVAVSRPQIPYIIHQGTASPLTLFHSALSKCQPVAISLRSLLSLLALVSIIY